MALRGPQGGKWGTTPFLWYRLQPTFKQEPLSGNAYHEDHTPPAADRKTNFDMAFNAFYPRLCLYAFRLLRDRDLAEDLVQDCFVKMWERRDRDSFPLPYLYTCVRNAAYAHFKYGKSAFTGPALFPEPVDEEDVRRLIETETLAEIWSAMGSLPPKCREVLSLLFEEGKSYAEIARDLRISESTIRTHKAKGISLIRQRLKAFLFLLF